MSCEHWGTQICAACAVCEPKVACVRCGTWPMHNRAPSICNTCLAAPDSLEDLAREMIGYVPEYFREKWQMEERLQALTKGLH